MEMEREREKGNSLGVPYQRPSAGSGTEEAAIRLIVSRCARSSTVSDRKTIREQEGGSADST